MDIRCCPNFQSADLIDVGNNQGRILIPADLRKYASLEKEAVIIGVHDRIEIWSRDKWEAYSENAMENYNTILDDMTRFGI